VKTIYFVRHCAPDKSVHEDRIRPLTGQGKRDAQRLTERFAGVSVDRVVSSPYVRAIDTVKGIADQRGLTVETDADLRERAVGTWVEDFDTFARSQWADLDWKLPGGESLRETMERNVAALNRLLAHPAETTVVGAHGTALSTLIRAFDTDYGYADFRKIQNVMPWVVRFTFDGHALIGWETVELD